MTATASSGLTVAFTIDASASSVCSISGSTVSFTAAGTCAIDANQAGNANYNPAPQVQQSFGVTLNGQTITFTSTAPAGARVGGATYNVTATASSGLTVTFTIDASAAAVCSITGSTVSFTAKGTCAIDANQAGNGTYAPAPQAQQSFTVTNAPTATDDSYNTTVNMPLTQAAPGVLANDVLNGATILSYGATTGSEQTTIGTATPTSAAGSITLNADGSFSYTPANNFKGADTFKYVLQNADGSSTATVTINVNKGDQTITFTSSAPANAKVGGTTYNVTATASSGLTVALTIDASAASVCSISGSTVSFIAVGTCVIDANQAGDANFNPAPQVQQSFAVAKGDQTITFTSTAPAGAKVGGPTYNVTATASSGLAVAFTIDASAAAVCSISGSTVSFQSVGTCVIDANQAGSGNYNPAPQAQQSFAVAKGDQTITFTSTAPANAKNGGATYTVTATASSGLTPVTFTIDASASAVCSISGSTVSFIGGGTCVIDANQAGSANYNAAPQAQQSFAVAKADQTITFTSTAPTMATPGVGSYSVTATATSGLTVTFTIDATATSFCSISGSTVSFTADGTCVIDAHQVGDTNYNAAPQVQQSFVVDTPPTVTSTNPANNATNVALASTISITFSKSVTVTGSAFQLTCSPGTAPSFTVTPASPATTYVLHPSANLPFDSSCTVTVVAAQVSDAASRNMVSNFMFSFATPPIANADTYPETLIGNVSINSAAIAYSVTGNDNINSPVTISAFDATSANGGTVSMTTSGAGIGQFTYNPKAGYTGADTFNYTISNAHGSSSATVHLTLSGIIWFINNNAGAGDGRLSSPFNSLAAFQAVNDGAGLHPAANANIFLYDSATGYTGPVTLLNGQKFIGQDATSSLSTVTGLTPGTSSATLPSTGGGSPNKVSITATGNDVTLGSGNTVWGLTLGHATGGLALSGASVGSLKIRDTTVNTAGSGVSLANGVLDAIFQSISTNGGSSGINVGSSTGSLTVNGGTIASSTGDGVVLNGAVNVTLSSVTVSGSTHRGIVGTGLSGFSMSNSSVTNNGTTANVDHGIDLRDVSGTLTFTNDTVTGNHVTNLFFGGTVSSTTVTTSLTVTGGTYGNSATNSGIQVGMTHTSTLKTATFTNVTFSGNASTGLQVQSNDNSIVGDGVGAPATGTVTVSGCTFTNNAGNTAIDIDQGGGGGAGQMYARLMNNLTITGNGGPAINVFNSSSATGGTMKVRIDGNHVGNASVSGSGTTMGPGIRVFLQGKTTNTVTIVNNVVRQTLGSRAIDVEAVGPTATGQPITVSDITIIGNDADTNDEANPSGSLDAIYVAADNQGSPAQINAEIHGNTIPHSTGASGAFDFPTFDGNAPWLYYRIATSGAKANLVDFSGPHANANAAIAATQTSGTAGADITNFGGVQLIAGPINVVP